MYLRRYINYDWNLEGKDNIQSFQLPKKDTWP